MEDQILRLVEKTWRKYQGLGPSQRLLVAISGIPGSGKTTLAKTVASRLNQLELPDSTHIATYVPMDGYHLSRAQLSSMPDPKTAHDRRGAEFTFDGTSFLHLVEQVRKPVTSSSTTIYCPSFDHAIKDPVANGIKIEPAVRVVIFEGNYLSLDKSPWREAAHLMDELWFVEVAFEEAGRRLVNRHVAAGIAADHESAWIRIRDNDLVNGLEIVENKLETHETIKSYEDNMFSN